MAIERLSAEDQLMLWPDDIWPQEIGALAILDRPVGIDEVRQTVSARLHVVPRLRQLLYVPPRRMGPPLWVDAPAVDLDAHLHVVALEAPGDEAALLLAVERLVRRRLDRSRPLWEMWFFTGMADGRGAMFAKMHHAIADGIAGVATIGAFLDIEPGAAAMPEPDWAPRPQPGAEELLADNRRRREQGVKRGMSTLAHPVASARRLKATWPALHDVLAGEVVPATSLDHVVGPGRRLAIVRARIDLVKQVAHANGGKVNDVLLAAIGGGVRRLLVSRGEAVDTSVRVYVPVTLRQGDRSHAVGNEIAQMVVPVPIGASDPAVRLRQISAETALLKARTQVNLGKLPTRGITGRAVLKLLDRQRVNVTSANVPGPPMELYLAGARVLEVFPVLPLIARVALGVGAISYAGQFNIVAVADRDAYPDLDAFVAGLRDDLRALGVGEH